MKANLSLMIVAFLPVFLVATRELNIFKSKGRAERMSIKPHSLTTACLSRTHKNVWSSKSHVIGIERAEMQSDWCSEMSLWKVIRLDQTPGCSPMTQSLNSAGLVERNSTPRATHSCMMQSGGSQQSLHCALWILHFQDHPPKQIPTLYKVARLSVSW